MTTRRSFLKTGAALTLGAAMLPAETWAMGADTRHIGLQLWSIREDMKTDPWGTLKQVAKMGYREVEGGVSYDKGKYYGKSPKEFKKFLMGEGLSMVSNHFAVTLDSWDAKKKELSKDFKTAVEAGATVGQKFLINPWMGETNRNEEDIKKLCEIFNKAGEYTKAHGGLQFGYHNHDFEFQKIGDVTILDYLLKNTQKSLVTFEMDIYWVHHGNANPFELIEKNPGRFQLCHVKDMAKTDKRETCEVGTGSIDFQKIFDVKKKSGMKYFIVELENYVTKPMQGVDLAYKNIKTLKF